MKNLLQSPGLKSGSLLVAALILTAALGCTAADPADSPATSTPGTTRGEPSPQPSPASTPPNEPGPAPSPPPPAAARNMTLTSPREGEPVRTNPIRISGTARTFENHVSVRVRDEEGQIIARSFTTARGELGSFNPWDLEVYLTSWPGHHVIVEAFDVSAKDGSEQSLVKVQAPVAIEPRDVQLFFHDPKRAPNDCSQVFAVTRRMPTSISLARLVVEALIAGPLPFEAGEASSSHFPRGSQVRGIAIRDGVATVDFNEALRNVGGSCRAQAIRASVEKSLRALPGIQRVVIKAAGSEELALQP